MGWNVRGSKDCKGSNGSRGCKANRDCRGSNAGKDCKANRGCRAYKGSKDGWIAPIAQIAPIDGFRTTDLTSGRVGFCVVGQPKRKVEIFFQPVLYTLGHIFLLYK